MILRNFARSLILRTNPFFPFNYLNKLPYYLAIRIFVLIFKSFYEIKSIYLRHGISQKNWIPALSDIDLTVILKSGLSNEESYSFLKKFWVKFARLKKIFPMIGETDLLNEDEMKNWTMFTVRGYEADSWILLYGKEIARSNYRNEPAVYEIDSINYAMTTYLEYFIPKFYSDSGSDFIITSELNRIAEKISRYSNRSSEKNNKLDLTYSPGKSELLYSILKRLESAVKKINFPEINKNENLIQNNFLNNDKKEDFPFESREFDTAKLEECKQYIESIIISYTVKFIVLKDDIKSEPAFDCIEKIRNSFKENKTRPVILNFALFEYYLRVYNPFIYSQLRDARKIIWGEDLFMKIKSPDNFFYRKSLTDEVNNIFLFPNKKSLMTKEIRNFIQNGFNSDFYRGLMLKLFLEKSFIHPVHNIFYNECKKNYPHYFQQADDLTAGQKSFSEEQLSFSTHNLLKNFSSEINKLLDSSVIQK